MSVSPLDPRPYYLNAVLTWRPDATERPDRMMLFALKMAPAWDDVAATLFPLCDLCGERRRARTQKTRSGT